MKCWLLLILLLIEGIENEEILMVCSIDGTIYGVSQKNGKVLWSKKEDPLIQSQHAHGSILMLPSPRDGSIHIFNSGSDSSLQNVFTTIPKMVLASPKTSDDGYFHLGSKSDKIATIDLITGEKIFEIGMDQSFQSNHRFISNYLTYTTTTYKTILYNKVSGSIIWNVSYISHNSIKIPIESTNVIFMSCSTESKLVAIDRFSGLILWNAFFDSPIVNVYSTTNSKHLYNLPFFDISDEHCEISQDSSQKSQPNPHNFPHSTQFNWTDFLLHHSAKNSVLLSKYKNNYYAKTILTNGHSPKENGKFIEGISKTTIDENSYSESFTCHSDQSISQDQCKMLSPLQIPSKDLSKLSHITPSSPHSLDVYIPKEHSQSDERKIVRFLRKITADSPSSLSISKVESYSFYFSRHITFFVTFLVISIITIIYSFNYYFKKYHHSKKFNYLNESSSKGSEFDGFKVIGKVKYSTNDLIGKGCAGTVVYRGYFETRKVAIKRIVTDCFNFTKKEIEILSESDYHPNIVRYYGTEIDGSFMYIALELGITTLYDFVLNFTDYIEVVNCDYSKSVPFSLAVHLIHQAANGIHHLHNLNIVHRDVKPHNILIQHLQSQSSSYPIKALISDFGFCKKLNNSCKYSVVSQSIVGTDGWIAPEVFGNNKKLSKACDIFSYGLVSFFALTNGHHPFENEETNCQINILSKQEPNLEKLNLLEQKFLCTDLITLMLRHNPAERPSSISIINHPMFWDTSKISQYLMQVSNRIEKEPKTSTIISAIESTSLYTIRGNWFFHIDKLIIQDLSQHRRYSFEKVRDLLRAIRNKKNHFEELPAEIKAIYGQSPDEVVNYFVSRFPRLVIDVYRAIQTSGISQEHYFLGFY